MKFLRGELSDKLYNLCDNSRVLLLSDKTTSQHHSDVKRFIRIIRVHLLGNCTCTDFTIKSTRDAVNNISKHCVDCAILCLDALKILHYLKSFEKICN